MQRSLDLLPGPKMSLRQEKLHHNTNGGGPGGGPGGGSFSSPLIETEEGRPKVLLLYFLGGVTHMEISALRLLNKRAAKSGGGWTILIATTNLINGNSLLREMIDVSVSRSGEENGTTQRR